MLYHQPIKEPVTVLGAPSGSVIVFSLSELLWLSVLAFFILLFIKKRQKVLLIIIALSMPLTTEFIFQIGISITLGYFFGLLLCIYFWLDTMSRRRKIYFDRNILITFYVIIFISIISLVFAPEIPKNLTFDIFGRRNPTIRGITELLRWVFTFLVIIAVYNAVNKEKDLQEILHWHVFSGTLVSFSSLSILFLTYLNVLSNDISAIVIEPGGRILRLSGFNQEPSVFAFYLLTVIGFTYIFILNKQKILGKLNPKMALFAQLLAFLFTYSTGGLITFILALIAVVAFSSRSNLLQLRFCVPKKIGIISAVLLSGVLFITVIGMVVQSPSFIYSVYMEKIASSLTTARGGRYLTDLTVIYNHPLTGVGIGKYPYFFDTYKPDWGVTGGFSGPGSMILGVFATTGIFGFIAFLFFFYLFHKRLLVAFKKSLYKENNIFIANYFTFWVIFFHLLIQKNFLDMFTIFILGVLLASTKLHDS